LVGRPRAAKKKHHTKRAEAKPYEPGMTLLCETRPGATGGRGSRASRHAEDHEIWTAVEGTPERGTSHLELPRIARAAGAGDDDRAR
jgi:hypothetical protein